MYNNFIKSKLCLGFGFLSKSKSRYDSSEYLDPDLTNTLGTLNLIAIFKIRGLKRELQESLQRYSN